MGLFKEAFDAIKGTVGSAATGAVSSVLKDQWKEYIYCDSLSSDVLVKKGVKRLAEGSVNNDGSSNIISDGSKIAVNEGQFLIIVENGKIVDYTSEAGSYTYKTGTEPSLFDSGFQGLKDSFSKVGKRFTFGGQAENDQRVYFINIKEIMDNKVGIGDVPFRDSEFGFTIKLHGFGSYSYKIVDPLMFYTNVCANVTDKFMRSTIDEQLKAEVQHNLQPALGRIALKQIPYDQLTLFTKDIADELNKELSNEWVQRRGIAITSVAFSSIAPDDESAKKINQFQESRVYTNAQMMGARLGAANANAMESAASNSAGAMTGFMGLGFAQQAGSNAGNSIASFYGGGQQQQQPMQQQPMQPNVQHTSGASWTCPSCGVQNVGKFCGQCGTKQPEPQQSGSWTCSCGTVNTGKFCSNCGTKQPQAAPRCNCGYVFPDPNNLPKFCPECGQKL